MTYSRRYKAAENKTGRIIEHSFRLTVLVLEYEASTQIVKMAWDYSNVHHPLDLEVATGSGLSPALAQP